MTAEERTLRRIANLVALRHQAQSKEELSTVLDGVAYLVAAGGWADSVDAL